MKNNEVMAFDKLMEIRETYDACIDSMEPFIALWGETKRDDVGFYEEFVSELHDLQVERYDSEYAYVRGPYWAEDECYSMPLAFVYSQEFRDAAEVACVNSISTKETNKKLAQIKLDQLTDARKAQYELLKKEFG